MWLVRFVCSLGVLVAAASLFPIGANAQPLAQGQLAAPATSAPQSQTADYLIGPLDKLAITVFQVEDLTLKEAQVDASGRLALPLIGTLMVAGQTPTQLAEEIRRRLAAGYLQSPQVSVIILEAVSQKVTVDGAVTEPGVFELKGQTTLMQAVAMAKGPAKNANLKRVAVFRQVDGKRMAAMFDLAAIRSGKNDDPPIFGNDVVVVDSSAMKSFWREVVGALPAFGIFRPY